MDPSLKTIVPANNPLVNRDVSRNLCNCHRKVNEVACPSLPRGHLHRYLVTSTTFLFAVGSHAAII